MQKFFEMVKITLAEKINRARDGRTQSWIVQQMNIKGCEMTDVKFSRKKMGYSKFTDKEYKVLQEILKIC